MEMIQSFSVDHTKIIPGIYVSRVDEIENNYCYCVSKSSITTYDIRMKRPNVEPAIDVAAMHSLEHIIATYLRNTDEWKDKIIYWGPMGCLTGFYLIVKGTYPPCEIWHLIVDAFSSVLDAKEVPGAAAVNCGNYQMHNLVIAKYYAKEFITYLAINKDNNDIYEYPKTERLMTDEGQEFFDS
jgi:S-ribosylhomocysteine lyase